MNEVSGAFDHTSEAIPMSALSKAAVYLAICWRIASVAAWTSPALCVRVPQDIGLMGFSNSEITELIDPPLSIIKQPAFEMGQIATELLFQMLESKRPVTEFETRVMAPQLIIRDSSRKGKLKELA